MQDCDCDDECEKCAVEFDLNITNDGDVPLDVTSNDLIRVGKSSVVPVNSVDPGKDARPVVM